MLGSQQHLCLNAAMRRGYLGLFFLLPPHSIDATITLCSVGSVAGWLLCVSPQLSPTCPGHGAMGLPMYRGSSSRSHPATPPLHAVGTLDPQMCYQHHQSIANVRPMGSPAPLCPHEAETSLIVT